MWLNIFVFNNVLKFFIFQVLMIATILSVTAQNKHTKNILMDFDYLVSQLYVQHCTFVEIGEGVCSIFIELPLAPRSCRKRSTPRQLYFGNCLCSEFRSWQLCSHQLAQARPEDCVFEEGTDCPTSSARVHRRLCDVTGMSQWNQQCNCSVPLAGQLQEPLCGFRTCYSNPLPTSICTPRTVCGTARCDVSLHGAVYGIKCDRKCKDRQSFCERVGPATSLRRPVSSEWSQWNQLNCDDRSSGIQQHEAECLDQENKPAFDCLGPGTFCCGKDDVDCICEVKQEEGHLKVYRYTITLGSSTVPDHNCLQVRSAVGFKGQAKVWNRLLNIGSNDDDSESLFSNLRERKPKKTIKLQHPSGIKINVKDLIKEDAENLLSSGVNMERSNISLVQGVLDTGRGLNDKTDDSTGPLILKVEPSNMNAMVTPMINPLNYTVSDENNTTTDQAGIISKVVIGNGQIHNKYDTNYHYTQGAMKGMEKSVTLPPSGKKSNKKQYNKNENHEIINSKKEEFRESEGHQMDKLNTKPDKDLEKENIIADKDNSISDEKVIQEQPKHEELVLSKPKTDDSQVKKQTSNFYEGAKIKEGTEALIPVINVQRHDVSNIQSINKTTGSLQTNLTVDKQVPKQTNQINGNGKDSVSHDTSKIDPSKNISNIKSQPKDQQLPVKQESVKNNTVGIVKNQTGNSLKEKNTLDIGNLLPNNSSQVDSSILPKDGNVSKSNGIDVTTPQTTTFNSSGIIVKQRVETDKTLDSTTQSTTFNSSGIIVKNRLQTTLSPIEKTDRKSNGTQERLKSYSEDLEELSKIKKEEERKAHTSFYDEPEPVLKDLDKDSVDENMADVLNNVIGGKNEWVEKKVETAGKKDNPEEKSNLQQDKDDVSSIDKAEVRKSKSENTASFSSKMKKRKFHQG